MSLRNTARSLPALFRVGFYEAIAYRAEMLVWVLATTMPLIMLVLWTAVARDAPVGRYGQSQFVAYFLASFIVRQLTGAWVSWQMNLEVRQGTLAQRLLRPISPLVSYAVENWAAFPMRMIVALPAAVIALWVLSLNQLSADPVIWGIWAIAMLGAWLITFLAHLAIGCLALYMESSLKLMDVWLAVFFVFSGYLFPLEFLPPWLKTLSDWLPFQYQIGFPVLLMTGGIDRLAALQMLVKQWGFALLFAGCVAALWRGGLKRFAAYGG